MSGQFRISIPPENVGSFLTFSGDTEIEYWVKIG